jgi:hypothetical protein
MLCALTVRFFDGTIEDLRAGQEDSADYDRRREAADEFVESVGADGIYDVVEERSMD